MLCVGWGARERERKGGREGENGSGGRSLANAVHVLYGLFTTFDLGLRAGIALEILLPTLARAWSPAWYIFCSCTVGGAINHRGFRGAVALILTVPPLRSGARVCPFPGFRAVSTQCLSVLIYPFNRRG